MNAQRMTRVMLAGAVALALTALTVLLIALPATAGPTAQDGWTPIPTPTEYLIVDFDYVLTTVGGEGPTKTFPGQEVDGVTFGETTVESRPPGSMVFLTKVETDIEIQRVDLIVHFVNGASINLRAQFNTEQEAWRAQLNTSSYFMLTWAPFEFNWCVTDTVDEQVCTDRQPAEFWDPDQEWFRAETEHAILYWYGFYQDDPDYVARQFARTVAALHPRLVEGFGRDISYKPVAVLYPRTVQKLI
jgi:hypothetical protein